MEFIYLNSRRTKSFAPHNMINHLKLIFKKVSTTLIIVQIGQTGRLPLVFEIFD